MTEKDPQQMKRQIARLEELVAAHEQVLALFAAWARSRKTGALQAATKRLNIVPGPEEYGRAAIERLEEARRLAAFVASTDVDYEEDP